jgi:hypothetical protein
MTDHSGSCLCGTVRFEIHGDFDSFYLCVIVSIAKKIRAQPMRPICFRAPLD